ncbi:choice-of-anchor A family protein [Sphingomonas canadensis]|uniref:Choice-of-anchor A family protein n=1 Tax=Sphingomonas canadensis TaxID=1219257 RepID=A0ABW3HFX0_9SPHN|nr:choice-of-anchor A family protein [Sphingomonas canadensis]MCW3838014.1 choice-of-anchor A family protein [Sphingomonas canadensis]
MKLPMFTKRHAILFAGAALLAMPASAGPLVMNTDALRTWNLVVLGDLESSSEVEGRTFVGGNLNGNSSNYQIGTPTPAANETPGLIVVGDVNGGTKNLNNGSGAIVGGNVNSGFNLNGPAQTVQVGGTISNTNVNQNTVNSSVASSNPNFRPELEMQKNVLTSSLTDLSNTLSGLDSNSTVSFNGNRATFNAAPDANGLAVFNLTAAQLDQIGEIQFNLNGADTAIVNVAGANVNLNDNFLGGTANLGEHVIWNFNDAKTLNLTTAWGGSVLAPGAAATTSNYVQGSAVFGSLVQNGEMHLGTYTGSYNPPANGGGGESPVPVPEAPPLTLFLLGAAGLMLGLRIHRRRAAAN